MAYLNSNKILGSWTPQADWSYDYISARANTDISYDNKGVVVHVDLPGFAKKDIDVTFESNNLIIRACRALKDDDLIKGTGPGPTRLPLKHRVPVVGEFNLAKIKAKLDLGVLRITLPFKEKKQGSAITIE